MLSISEEQSRVNRLTQHSRWLWFSKASTSSACIKIGIRGKKTNTKIRAQEWETLTRLVSSKHLVGLMPKRPAVLLQLEEATLLPRLGTNLDQLATNQQELQVHISL